MSTAQPIYRGSSATAALTGGALPRGGVWFLAAAAGLISASVILGILGRSMVEFVLVGVLLFVLILWATSYVIEGRRKATDRFVTSLISLAFSLAILPLLSVLWTVVQSGLARFDMQFFTSDMLGVVGVGGGALHAIIGTLLVTGAAAAVSIPLGIMTAVYLVEYGQNRLASFITLLVDVMTGIPSIVAGLFAYALFTLIFGPGIRLGIGGAVALSLLMVPIVVRSTEEMLKLVPNDLREAAYALGVPKWRTITRVVLPTAAAGIGSGVTLAVARVIGETAPLLVIAGSTAATNLDLFAGRMQTLPIFTYYSYTQPGIPPEAAIDRAWAAALTLMVIVMILNVLARFIARFFAAAKH